MRTPFLAAATLFVAVAACTPARAPWTAPGVAQDQVDADWADCRRVADQRLEPMPRDATGTGRTPYTNPLDELDRRAAARSAQRDVAACMRAKGYFPER